MRIHILYLENCLIYKYKNFKKFEKVTEKKMEEKFQEIKQKTHE